MIVDFYRHFPDVELIVFQEVFNGVWDALADGRVELAIGATRSFRSAVAMRSAIWGC